MHSKKKSYEKPVIQMNKRGKEIARYCSAAAAEKLLGTSRASISKICRSIPGRQHAGGYSWKFAI